MHAPGPYARRTLAACLAAGVLAACAQAPTTAPAQAPAAAPRLPDDYPPAAPPPPYVAPDVPQGSGPYRAIMRVEPSLPTHTVYRPAQLAALGAQQKLPVVAWGNGACVALGNRFRYFLTEIASHGFIAIAIGPVGPAEVERMRSARGKPSPKSPAAFLEAAGLIDVEKLGPGILPAPFSTAAELTQAIDWAAAENKRPGSPYFGKLDLDKVAVMGQSCGGVQAIAAAFDPRVKTLGVWNSGLFDNPRRPFEIAAAPVTKAHLKLLKLPTLYVTGAPTDVAFKNADDDFDRLDGMPVFRAWMEQTGHGGTYREPDGGAYGRVASDWLRWQLLGDSEAAKTFVGPACRLCTNAQWHVKRKLID
jgi:hypothetical protein